MLLLSRDAAYAMRNQVTVAPVTTRIRELPVEVRLSPADGVPQDCVDNLDTLTTIPKSLLDQRITALTADRMAAVEETVRFALGLR